MNANKIFHASVRSIENQTKQVLSRFVQNGIDALSGLFKPGQLEDLIKEYSPNSRNRLYSPLTTIGMFLDQVFSADHSCQDAVVQELSNRVAQDLSESSLNTGPYCKARKRLSSTLLSALCQTVADNLLQSQSKFRFPDPQGIVNGTLDQTEDHFCTSFGVAKPLFGQVG